MHFSSPWDYNLTYLFVFTACGWKMGMEGGGGGFNKYFPPKLIFSLANL